MGEGFGLRKDGGGNQHKIKNECGVKGLAVEGRRGVGPVVGPPRESTPTPLTQWSIFRMPSLSPSVRPGAEAGFLGGWHGKTRK
jgi:hypothetical protein